MKFAYTLAEVSELTGISERSLADGCRAGEIPHTIYRRQRVMTPAHIEAFLASRAQPPQQAVPDPDVARIEQHRQRVAARLSRKAGAA